MGQQAKETKKLIGVAFLFWLKSQLPNTFLQFDQPISQKSKVNLKANIIKKIQKST